MTNRIAPQDADADYLDAFAAGRVSPETFRHREHLQLAWACLRQARDPRVACERVSELIRRFVGALGLAQKYHVTLTVFWVLLLWEQFRRLGDVPFAAVIAHNPAILDKEFVFRFYPRELLMSPRARAEWIAPTLRPIGDDAFHFETDSSPAASDPCGGRSPGPH